MARERAYFNVTIWQDQDFRNLPALAKQLYFDMWTHPELSYCGVVDWRPGRFAAQHPDLSTSDILVLAGCLEARLFIVPDNETEEVLLRSWVRFDGLLKQPRLAVSYANAFAAVASNEIRGVLIHEAVKLHNAQPELAGWAKPQVANMLTLASVDPRARALPKDPFGDGFPKGFSQRLGENPPSVSVPPSPSPSPSPSLPTVPDDVPSNDGDEVTSRRKPETALPASWAPTAKHYEFATEQRIDIAAEAHAFRGHADTHDRRARNWDAAFRTWLGKAKPTVAVRTGSTVWDRPVRSAS